MLAVFVNILDTVTFGRSKCHVTMSFSSSPMVICISGQGWIQWCGTMAGPASGDTPYHIRLLGSVVPITCNNSLAAARDWQMYSRVRATKVTSLSKYIFPKAIPLLPL
jgi:hypothetical protein